MKVPKVRLAPLHQALPLKASPARPNADGLIAFVFVDDVARPTLGLAKVAIGSAGAVPVLPDFLKKRGFTGKPNDLLYCPRQDGGMLVLVGLGTRKRFSLETARIAAASSLHVLEQLRIKDAVVVWPEKLPKQTREPELVGSLVEGIILGAYEFDRYKHAPAAFSTEHVTLAPNLVTKAIHAAFDQKQLVAAAVNETRNLQNDNSDEVTPDHMADYAKKLAQQYKLTCTVLDGPELKKRGLSLLHAVGRASDWQPKLILLEYRGNRSAKERIALIGKGVTFDTGGVNLKPSHGMIHEMHLDMSGAAAVMTVLRIAAELKLKTNLIGVVPVAENAIGGNAYKPGSVLKAYNGKTVEIGNTDAEGRLILADANAYAVKQFAPTAIINIATLSGVTLYTFGEHYAGLVSNHDQLAEQLYQSSQRTAEWVWPLPLVDFYREQNKSRKADLANVSPTRRMYGDTIQAGAFLEAFSGEIPMAFIDIAGASMRSSSFGYQPAGGTGFGVRLLLDYVLHNARGPKKAGAGSRGLGRYAN